MKYVYRRDLLLTCGIFLMVGFLAWKAFVATQGQSPSAPPTAALAPEPSPALPQPDLNPSSPAAARQATADSKEFSSPRPIQSGKASTAAASEGIFADFDRWAKAYAQAEDEQTKAALETEGLALARQRREAMYSMIQNDPQQALRLSLSKDARANLPASIQALVEQPVVGRGDLAVLGALPMEGHEQDVLPYYRTATLGGHDYRAFVYGARADQPTSFGTPMRGVTLDDVIALDEDPIRVPEGAEKDALVQTKPKDVFCSVSGLEAGANNDPTPVDVGGEILWLCGNSHTAIIRQAYLAAAGGTGSSGGTGAELAESSYTEGRKRLIIFRVAFADVPTPTLTQARGIELVDGANTYWRAVSFGRTSVAAVGQGSDVIQVNLTQNAAFYDNNAGALRDAVRAAATAAGTNLALYDFDITATGNAPAFDWAGLGFVGAPGSWIRSGGSFSVGVTVHELGHNLGLPHSNFWDTQGQSDIGSGGNEEYGDPYDVMGGGGSTTGHYNAKFKYRLGWMPEQDFPRIMANGTYRVYTVDNSESTGLRGFRVRHDAAMDLHFEFRQLITGNPWMMQGLAVRWGSTGGSSSQLIDTTPSSRDGKNDAAVVIGRTWSDAVGNVHITPTRLGRTYPQSIDVVVNFGPFPGNQPPEVAVRAGTTATGTGSPLTFTAEASDPNGDTLAYAWDFGDGTFGNNSPTVTHSWGTASDYMVRCTVSDMKGGTSSHGLLVRIGTPSSFSISGRIVQGTTPVEGVLVRASSTQYDYTKSDGTYTITGLGAANYSLSALKYPLTFANPWFANPVPVGPSAVNKDFLAVSVAVDDVSLIAANAAWKYLDNGTDQGTAWRGAGFVDASWASGAAQLGYGDGDEATVVGYGPDANNKFITTYFRHAFNVPDPAAITNVTLNFHRDDGGIVYLNGVEILRENLPVGTINASTLAIDASEGTAAADVPHALLVPGNNVLAAEVHQVLPNSSDLSFYASVVATSLANLQDLSLVYIASPLDKQRIQETSSLPITVNAFYIGGSFELVEFFADGAKIGEDNAAPFSLNWPAPSRGTHTLSIAARDHEGTVFTPPAIKIDIVEPTVAPSTLNLVTQGSTWKYMANGSNQGTAWRDVAFNDAAWPSGAAQLGYGDGDEATMIPSGPTGARFITSYFRRAFIVTDPSRIIALGARVLRDDGAVVYLNGVEVFRSNMPSGIIEYLTQASSAISGTGESTFNATVIDPALLVAGANVVAVEIHQSDVNSTDVSFDFALDATLAPPPGRGVVLNAPVDNSTVLAPANVLLRATPTPGTGQSIANLSFYEGDNLIGSGTPPNYTFTWINPAIATYQITARATETGGLIMTSAVCRLTIDDPDAATALVSAGALWKYLDTGVTPAAPWTSIGFDDSLWASGSARLGYGGDGESTVIGFGPNPAHRYITTWFRRAFNVADPSAFSQLKLRLQRDDGAVVYLNGVELYRANMEPGLISPNSLASVAVAGTDEQSWFEALTSPAALHVGNNVLAVEVHQQAIDSSDLGFDLELFGLTDVNLTEGVILTTPGQSAQFNMPATVALGAYVQSASGVSLIEYYAGDTKIGQASAPPYTASWINPAAGTYALTARTVPVTGPAMISPPVQIQVGPAPVPITPVFTTLVPLGATWSYLDDGSDQGEFWRGPGFNAASWPTGPARLGYGLDGEITSLLGGHATTYFRHQFAVANPGLLDTLGLRLQRDDGVIVYLNGNEIFRNNMPPAAAASSTLASTTVDGLEEQAFLGLALSVSGSGLVAGNNTLAVEIHQSSATSSDMGFDLELLAYGSTAGRAVLSSPAAGKNFEPTELVDIQAYANPPQGGTIARVEFYADGVLIGQSATAPYQMNWADGALGTHELAAVAIDGNGAAYASPPVTISIGVAQLVASLVPAGATWKYLDNGSDQGTAWTQLGFSDSAWASGPARLGYGGDGEETTVGFGPSSTSKYITTYFRRTFNVADDITLTNLTIRLQRDDGAVVWVNGQEVLRSNMPAGGITIATLASSSVSGADETAWFETQVEADMVNSGPNVIAVELHQSAADSSDLGFDLEMVGTGFRSGGTPEAPSLSIQIDPTNPNRVKISWPTSATAAGWRLYNSVGIVPGSDWRQFNASISSAGGVDSVTTVHSGLLRFFRLQR